MKQDPALKEKQHFIVKPGALCLVNKTATQVEVEREPEYMRDTIYCSRHCAAYLYDQGKVVSLTQFTGLQTLPADCGIQVLPGSAGKTVITMADDMLAPQGYKWVVLFDDNPQFQGAFGTAVAGAKDWPGNGGELAAAGKLSAHVLLVNAADSKPVKVLSQMAVAG